jgi:hypothetical protein
MAVLQMLSEMICPEKFLCVIALSKLVHFLQMSYPNLPILVSCNRDRMTCYSRGRYP